jgi:hypothetical protein
MTPPGCNACCLAYTQNVERDAEGLRGYEGGERRKDTSVKGWM